MKKAEFSVFDPPFKVLYRNGDHYICDIDAYERMCLDDQKCWKTLNIADGGLR